MCFKVGFVGKIFFVFWVIEWFFICMGFDMILKIKKDIFIEVNIKRKIIQLLIYLYLFLLMVSFYLRLVLYKFIDYSFLKNDF